MGSVLSAPRWVMLIGGSVRKVPCSGDAVSQLTLLLHKVCVALRMVRRKPKVLVKIDSHDKLGERQPVAPAERSVELASKDTCPALHIVASSLYTGIGVLPVGKQSTKGRFIVGEKALIRDTMSSATARAASWGVSLIPSAEKSSEALDVPDMQKHRDRSGLGSRNG